MILRLARENPRWGYSKIEGELVKLGFQVSRTTIRNVLKAHGIALAPVRGGSISWRQLMTHYKEQILACDFFTVETAWLQTLYVLFFIGLKTRRVHLAAVTANPTQLWVKYHDNDGKFSEAFPNRQAQHTGPVQRRKVLGGIINDGYRSCALSYAT